MDCLDEELVGCLYPEGSDQHPGHHNEAQGNGLIELIVCLLVT